MLVKKRQILAATLVVALAAAVTVNWYYSKYDPNVSDPSSSLSQESVQGNLGDSLLVAGTAANSENTTEEGETEAVFGNAKQYFADAKLKKTECHDEIEDEVEYILENGELDQSAKDKVNSILSKYAAVVKAETDAENLIKAKIGGECVVVINGDLAEVVIESGKMNENASLQIAEIIEKNTNIPAENLTIIEAK